MIFYFTGTGNSLFAAKRLLDEGEKLVSIAEAMKKNEYDYTLTPGEKLGFVFPVYFYSVPDIILKFIDKLNVDGAEYTYGVITCGGGISQSGGVLKKALGRKGINLDFVTPLLMPDNSMLFYQIPPQEENSAVLKSAEGKLTGIKTTIDAKLSIPISSASALSDLMGFGYKLCNKTEKFFATDSCISCGLCEKMCPVEAISLSDGKPVWIKDKCVKCSACINRCPKKAIQYGKATLKRNRYINPEL